MVGKCADCHFRHYIHYLSRKGAKKVQGQLRSSIGMHQVFVTEGYLFMRYFSDENSCNRLTADDFGKP